MVDKVEITSPQNPIQIKDRPNIDVINISSP